MPVIGYSILISFRLWFPSHLPSLLGIITSPDMNSVILLNVSVTSIDIHIHTVCLFLNPFVWRSLSSVTPLEHFCYILIKPCYTFVTLLLHPYYTMLHPCNTFAASLFHHLHCGILSVFDFVAFYPVAFRPVVFCPDTPGRYKLQSTKNRRKNLPISLENLKYSLKLLYIHSCTFKT